jgi:hypothetical protein
LFVRSIPVDLQIGKIWDSLKCFQNSVVFAVAAYVPVGDGI